MMAYPILTIEVFEGVIDQASDHSASLRQLSLLCSTFLPRARYHLFSSIRIWSVEQMESSREFFRSHPWLLPLVKTVSLAPVVSKGDSPPGRNTHLLDVVPAHLLTQFPNLRTWRMTERTQQLRLSFHRCALSCYLKYGVGIRNLHLACIIFVNMSDFRGFISAFTRIHTLHCYGVSVWKTQHHSSLDSGMNMVTRSLAIKSLHIQWLPMMATSTSTAEYLLNSSLATLNELVLTFDMHMGQSLFERLVKVIGRLSRLSSLTLGLSIASGLWHGTEIPTKPREVDHAVFQGLRGLTHILEHVDRAHLGYVQVEFIPDPVAAVGCPLSYDAAADLCKPLEDTLLTFPVGRLLFRRDPDGMRRAGRVEFWSPTITRIFDRLNDSGSLILPPARAKADTQDPLGHEGAVTRMVASRDSKLVVSASRDGTVIIWDFSSGMVLEEWLAHKGPVKALSLSPDCRRLASAGGIEGEMFVIWDIRKGVHRVAAPRGHTKPVCACEWSFDGTLIASASDDGTVRVWDGLTFEQRDLLDDPQAVSEPQCLLLIGDARYVAWVSHLPAGRDECRIWRPFMREPPKALLSCPRREEVAIHALACDAQCRRIAAASLERNKELEEHVTRIWDLATGAALAVLTGHAGEVREVQFSKDGASVLTASQDGCVKIWDAESGRETASLAPLGGDVHRACYSPDGNHIATASSGTVQLWRTADFSSVTVLDGHDEGITIPYAAGLEVEFSPDGKYLAFGGWDGIVHFRRLSDFL